MLCPDCKSWKEIETWREGKDLMVSLAHMCLLFQWHCFLLFSFAYSAFSKGLALQSVMPESAASLVVSYCARMPYAWNTKLSYKWAASQTGSKRNVVFCCCFYLLFFVIFLFCFLSLKWSSEPSSFWYIPEFYPKFIHTIHKEKYLWLRPGGALSEVYPKQLEV